MTTKVQTVTVTLPGDTIEVLHENNQRIEVVESRPYDPSNTTWTYLLYTFTEPE